jgi:hypothetical protein
VTGTPAFGPVSQTPQWKLVPLALLGDWKTATAVKVSAAVVKKLANDRVFIIYMLLSFALCIQFFGAIAAK